MALQVDFLGFANGTDAVVTSQSVWAGRTGAGQMVDAGFPSGILQEADLNKAIRQSSVVSAALANAISQTLNQNVLDSGGASSLTTLTAQILAMIVAGTPTGTVLDYVGATAPTGYVLATGGTIGNALSGATLFADPTTVNLFALLWNTDATNTIYVVAGGRGASAASDYAANKTISVPDLRGRFTAGRDNMGGTAANRITSAVTIDGTVLGNSGGSQSHTLIAAELPIITPTGTATSSSPVTDPTHTHGQVASTVAGSGAGSTTGSSFRTTTQASTTGVTVATTTTISINSFGSGNAHAILNPVWIVNKIIKL